MRDSEQAVLHQMYRAAENYERLRDVVWKVGIALSFAVSMTSFARAVDYLSFPPRRGESLLFLEVIGFEFWGYAYLVVAFGIFVTSCAALVWTRRGWIPLAVFHIVHIFVSMGLAVALAQGSFSFGGDYRAVALVLASIVSSICRVVLLNVERD